MRPIPTIERLGPSDVGVMRQVNALFGQVFEMPEEYGSKPPSDDYLNELLADGKFVTLAAILKGQVIGALTAYEMRKFEQERSEFYIYDLAVAEEERRKGVATALIGRLREIAKAQGAWTVMIQADWNDKIPVTLYSKLGKREDIHHFDIRP